MRDQRCLPNSSTPFHQDRPVEYNEIEGTRFHFREEGSKAPVFQAASYASISLRQAHDILCFPPHDRSTL